MVKRKLGKTTTVGIFVSAVVAMLACGGASAPASEAPNTDPRKGPVLIWKNSGEMNTLYKQCDKPPSQTLIYMTSDQRGGIAVIPNSTECM